MKRGLSFSGRERHCIFLNKQDGTFADISTVSGLDLPDDGRGSARCDWDHDGDLDFWVSNRNAPTIRFFENTLKPNGDFLAVRLTGITCNRDAIGARLQLQLTGEAKPLLRTLRAGEGFLSQSSKWIHFGLGEGHSIEQLTVNWPDGSSDIYHDLASNAHFRITQGEGKVTKWKRPIVPALPVRAPLEQGIASTGAAVTSLSRIPVPPIHYQNFAGNQVSLFQGAKKFSRPILINLWATWCAPCLRELADLQQRSSDLEGAGIDVIALCVDEVNEQGTGVPAGSPQDVAKKLNLPFAVGTANTQLVDTLQMVHDLMFDIHVPLPLPSSLLVDGDGRLLVIYKGQLNVDELLKDATSRAGLSGAERRSLTEPFPGIWVAPPRVLSFVDLATKMFKRGYTKEALAYYQKNSKSLSSHPQSFELMVLLGKALEKEKRHKDAIGAYRFGLTRSPDFTPALAALAQLLATCPDASLRDPQQALSLADKAVRLTNARDIDALKSLAAAFDATGQTASAKAVRTEINKLEKP
ncbi:MAG: thiol-disulfide isomerase/thioredoxin [Verrucomicrobiales bacterium]